ncbi:MAG: hypothetical protein SGCHY_001082 [Lobulomycetales sp.]
MSAETAVPLDLSFKDIPNLEELFQEGLAEGRDSERRLKKGVQRAIRLSNNRIHNISSLYEVCSALVKEPSEVKWIDLSFNQLTSIDEVILKFPKLVSLNLHANLIWNINEIDKLAALPNLRHLTLHGNPIDASKQRAGDEEKDSLIAKVKERQNQSGFLNMGTSAETPLYYRSYVIQKLPNLQRLDFSSITKQDRLNAKQI